MQFEFKNECLLHDLQQNVYDQSQGIPKEFQHLVHQALHDRVKYKRKKTMNRLLLWLKSSKYRHKRSYIVKHLRKSPISN